MPVQGFVYIHTQGAAILRMESDTKTAPYGKQRVHFQFRPCHYPSHPVTSSPAFRVLVP